jgi:hypothetical protein
VLLALPERAFRVLRHQDRHPSRAAEALIALITGGLPGSRMEP